MTLAMEIWVNLNTNQNWIRMPPNCSSRRTCSINRITSSEMRRPSFAGGCETNPAGPLATQQRRQLLTVLRSKPSRQAAPLNPYSCA